MDLAGPLRQFIRSHYGSVEKYAEECTIITRLRQDMRGAGRDESGRDLLYRYYGQLELLELRFPIDEDHIKISFTWYDAFTESPISQYSLAYEKACVLFNIASIMSLTASTQTRSEVAGMKKAYHSLQACAGLLNFINDNFLHAPSTDLSREMVKTLSNIMLAQAQEVFTEKQIKDAGKSSIIAKLAAEAANLYHIANDTLTELIIAGNIDSAWGPFCQVKEKYFSSLAHFYQACFEVEKDKFGLAVGRFAVSQTLMKEALTTAKANSGVFARYPYLSNDPGTALSELLKACLELITDRAAAAKKDNDVIYHEQVVKEIALPAVVKLASAKPISLHDLYAGQDVGRIVGKDIFQKLVPLSVHESASMYSEEIDKLLRAEQEISDIADVELSTSLDYLGLPKSLHQFKVSEDQLQRDIVQVPDSLRQLARNVVQSERSESMVSRLDRIQALSRKIADSIRTILKSLEEESRQCEHMRAKYGSRWTQAPSMQSTASMLNDLDNFRQSLQSAETSDTRMKAEFHEVQHDISQLAQNDIDLIFQEMTIDRNTQDYAQTSLLDIQEDDSDEDIMIKIDQVEDALKKLNLVKKERLQTLQDLKSKARTDDISSVLILNKKTPGIENRVFKSELEKFKPHQIRISATISRQEQLVEELTSTFKLVLENKANKSKQRKWESVSHRIRSRTKELDRAASTYQNISSGLSRAMKFYSDLDSLVENISTEARSFVQRRQQEGRNLYENATKAPSYTDSYGLRQQLESLSMNNPSGRPQPPIPDRRQSPY